jgi:outer membrane protein assembly factor BamB
MMRSPRITCIASFEIPLRRDTQRGILFLRTRTGAKGLYAYDATTGDQKWFIAMPGLYTGSELATSKAGLFMMNRDFNGDYIKGFNLSTGIQTWSTRAGTNDFLGFPVAMGNRVYTYNHRLNGLQTIQPRIVSYDAATGQPKDSINLPSGMNSPYRLVTSYN